MIRAPRRLPRSFYDRPTVRVAEELLGKQLVHHTPAGLRSGRIVETEAYVGPDDLACHAARGLTPRTRPMFGPPGHAYVYLIYGVHHCFNAVCEREGFPAAVLVRALEPGDGLDGGTRGPGKLCEALGITRALSGADLADPSGGELWIEERFADPSRVVATPRIGVDYAGEWAARPWRFVDADSGWLSRRLPRSRSS
jgi:DNA-3-methyladenine glycosylase